MGDKFWINGTKVHEIDTLVASPAGHGYVTAVELDFGTPNQETFLDPRSMADGMRFNGVLSGSRPFRVRLLISGVGTRAKGQDEWAYLLANVVAVENGLVSYKIERTDASAATLTRELLAIVTSEPAWAYVDDAGADGLRVNGNIVVAFDCVAPFPWWRDVAEQTEVIAFTGTGVGTADIDRGGDMACGLEAKVTTAGSLASLTVTDGTNSMLLTATFGASGKGVDWYYADPTATAIDSGVVISDTGHIELHSATTTVTCTPPGGASGNHTLTIKWKRLWKAP